MASQSLYRKWRSQTFDELVGQEHVVQTLRNAIVEERVAHAYLFTGPRGVGKTSMARLLAKAVNCLAADPAARPCGQCPACTSIAEGRAVDVIEMDAASNTSVEDARELIERVQFRPAELRSKVYVLDEVHMLSTAAFNALLKTLEEPPAHAIFIMATTEVHKVPATILSRCQRFTFTRHGVASTAAHLRRIAEAEGLALEEGAPEAIARAATGSMRDALSVLEQLASFSRGAVTLEQVHSLLGMTAAAEVYALIEALLDHDAAAALRAVGGVADQGADIRQFTRDLVERLRALLLLLASGDAALADAGEDERALMAGWAQRTEVPRVLHWVKTFSGLDHQLRTSPYGHLPLELAVVEALVAQQPGEWRGRPGEGERGRPGEVRAAVAARPSAPPPARPAAPKAPRTAHHEAASSAHEVVVPDLPPLPPAMPAEPSSTSSGPPALEAIAPPVPDPVASNLAPPPLPAPQDEASPAAESASPASIALPDLAATLVGSGLPAPVQTMPDAAAANADFLLLDSLLESWDLIKRDIKTQQRTIEALLKDVRPYDVEGHTIVLLAASNFHKTQVEQPKTRQVIETVLRKRLGGTYAIRCVIEEKKAEVRSLRDQIRDARQDKVVKAAMNLFDAEIIAIEQAEGDVSAQ